jgi:hypothetical protein
MLAEREGDNFSHFFLWRGVTKIFFFYQEGKSLQGKKFALAAAQKKKNNKGHCRFCGVEKWAVKV